jgi:hypothetical protein
VASVFLGRSFRTSRFNRRKTKGFMILRACATCSCSNRGKSSSFEFFVPSRCKMKIQ